VASPLENLSGPGNALAAEPSDAKEFAGLKQSGLVRLKDAENAANSLESRFDLAYNAAHALSLAALRCAGTATGQESVTSCFKRYRTPLAWDPKYGACFRNVTISGTWVSTKASSMSMSG
jgi:hypothetical protein